MRITISERLRPYQHVAGTQVLIPGTFVGATVFPALIRLHDFFQAEPKLLAEVPLPIRGPVKDFTVQQNLETGDVVVWGFGLEGYFRYRITYDNAVHILFDKGGENIKLDVFSVTFPVGDTVRLSLGNHKAQDWSLVKRRLDLTEILPAWLRLGELIQVPQGSGKGTAALLHKCRQLIDQKQKTDIVPNLTALFTVGFEGILSPRLFDHEYQGFQFSVPESTDSPLVLLAEGAQLISSLFVQPTHKSLSILPVLPPEFHSGRLVRYRWKGYGLIDMEWSKKMIKKMIFTSEVTDSIYFQFQKEVQRFRLNGVHLPVNQELKVVSGQKYLFDRFEK